jgi:hypothetical protein
MLVDFDKRGGRQVQPFMLNTHASSCIPKTFGKIAITTVREHGDDHALLNFPGDAQTRSKTAINELLRD